MKKYMRRYRIMAALLLMICLVAAAVGCSGEDEPAETAAGVTDTTPDSSPIQETDIESDPLPDTDASDTTPESETVADTASDSETETDENTIIASFAVFSDVHIGKSNVSPSPEDKFAAAMQQLVERMPDCDAVLFAGDITDLGTDAQYESFMQYWNEFKPAGAQLGAVMGNHEYFRDGVVRYGGESARFLDECQTAFETNVGERNVDMVVNGVHMIGLSTDNSAAQYASAEQFLRDHVKAAAEEDPAKPIIVYAHEGLGVYHGGGAGNFSSETVRFLQKYPQVIVFSGHTHYSLYDPRMINQKTFTTIQTSTMGADLWNYNEWNPLQHADKDKVSEGHLVTVTAGGVVTVTRYDFFRKMPVGQDWVIDIPAVTESRANFAYTDARAKDAADPAFPQDGVVTMTDITTSGVTVTFPAATVEDKVSDGQIYKYTLTVTKEGASAPYQTKAIQGEYYLGTDASASYTLPLTALRSGTTYTVTVTAETPWGKKASITSTSFTTEPSLGDGSEENLALDKKVTASGSAYNAEGWGIAMLTDGSIMQTSVDGTNGWMSNGVKNRTDSTWASIDLGEVSSVNRIVVYPRQSGERFPVGYYFEVSVDGTAWTKVAEETADPYTLDARIFHFETKDARYVRITTTEMHADSYVDFANGYMAQISEIEVYMIQEGDAVNTDAKVLLYVDYTSGSMEDQSENKLAVTEFGTPEIRDGAAVLDTASGYGYKLTDEIYDQIPANLTIEFDIWYDAVQNYATSANYCTVVGNTEGAGFGVSVRNDGMLFFETHDGTRYREVLASIPLNEWVHVAVTYDNETMKIFINGALAESATYSGDIKHVAEPSRVLMIGGDVNGQGALQTGSNIQIKYVRLYDKPLSARTIAELAEKAGA